MVENGYVVYGGRSFVNLIYESSELAVPRGVIPLMQMQLATWSDYYCEHSRCRRLMDQPDPICSSFGRDLHLRRRDFMKRAGRQYEYYKRWFNFRRLINDNRLVTAATLFGGCWARRKFGRFFLCANALSTNFPFIYARLQIRLVV